MRSGDRERNARSIGPGAYHGHLASQGAARERLNTEQTHRQIGDGTGTGEMQ